MVSHRPSWPGPVDVWAFADDVFASLARADQRSRGQCYLRGLLLDGRRGVKRFLFPAIGTWIQMAGVLTALAAGLIATRANYREQAQARQ